MQFNARGNTCNPASLGSVTLLEILVLLQRSILQNLLLHLQETPEHTQTEASLPSAEMPSQNIQIGQTPSLGGRKLSKEAIIRGWPQLKTVFPIHGLAVARISNNKTIPWLIAWSHQQWS